MKEYEIGKSNDCFNIFKKLITENINNQEKIKSYHQIFQKLLTSGKTGLECKKILCKEFSWMADDSYRKIYNKLMKNPELTAEAKYALDMLEN